MTDNIINSGLPHTPHAPVFPSLFAEGVSGGGYDVKIPLHPVPIFLQFKIPQIVRRQSDLMPNGFITPYLRMHLRTKRPNQHKLLLDLEATGKLVYYATPDFSSVSELDKHFTTQRVHHRSWYIRPSRLGQLDDRPHHVAYQLGSSNVWLCSQPKRLEGGFSSEAFAADLHKSIEFAKQEESILFLRKLVSVIVRIARRNTPGLAQFGKPMSAAESGEHETGRMPTPQQARESERKRVNAEIIRAAREVAYLANVHLGCTLVITGRD